MTEPGDEQNPITTSPERRRLAGVCADRVRYAFEDASWLLRRRLAWPIKDVLMSLGTRGAIGVFGGGGIATAGVTAAILVATAGGSGSTAPTTEAIAVRPAPAVVVAPAPKPKAEKKAARKPTAPTLHGAPPSFAPAEKIRSGVAEGKALGSRKSDPVASSASEDAPAARGSSAGAGDVPAATAKIGATPEASALATSRRGALAQAEATDGSGPVGERTGSEGLATPPAPKAAKQVARNFAEAFVAYEIGQTDSGVRKAFRTTSTKQLSKSLLKRPPRQPDGVKVPRAKVVNVVAGPSRGKVYSVSVSLLRVGVTSELRLQMEQGVGKKWQVTNVLG